MNDIPAQLKGAIEAIVFAAGEPISVNRIAVAESLTPEEVSSVLEELRGEYEERNGGIVLQKMDDKFQFITVPQYEDDVRKVLEVKRNAPLSAAAFEVLAVIAYNQPVTKSYVEQVRGVDCTGVITNLCQKGLIEEAGRLDLPGRPLLYCTTAYFLRCFCISSLDELPELPEDNNEVAGLAEIQKDNTVLNGQISIL